MFPFTKAAISCILTWALVSRIAYARTYTDFSQLPTTEYDLVIIGAGAAGNVLAARLTENPNFSVLVVEAGSIDEGVLGIEVPFLAPQNLGNTSIIWNYTTVPQTGLTQREIAYPRGKVLGGSTSLNFLVYTRGANEEYDRWAELTGDPGWSASELAPYYFKSSRLVPPADHHNTTGQVNTADHGFGPVEISLPGFPTEIDDLVLSTAKAPRSEFPFNVDVSSGMPLGVGFLQGTVGDGQRSSSATAYLRPALQRLNLHVLISNTVTKLIPTAPLDGKPTFKTVEFAPNSTAERSRVTARKEVILCAGSIGTPQILMLSGIGDTKQLGQFGIKTLVESPDVGQHLQDQPILANYWTVSSNQTLDNVSRDPNIFNADLALWQANRTGLFADAPANHIAFIRIPRDDAIFRKHEDPSAGPNTPHIEMLPGDSFSPGPAPIPAAGSFFTMHTIVVTPTSVGSVRLASADPFTFPLIDPAFLATSFDIAAMVYAVKAARRFVQTPPWHGFIVDRFGDVGGAETDDEIAAAARANVETIWHPTCTARMAPKDAPWGVVDPGLLVKGTSRLRIVDASIFPTYIAGHPVAAVYAVAERAADLIKAA